MPSPCLLALVASASALSRPLPRGWRAPQSVERAARSPLMLDVSRVQLGDKLRVAGTDSAPLFFHVPGQKQGFVAKGMVGTVAKIYAPGECDDLDRSDERDIVLAFDEPRKWKAHFHPSELELLDGDVSQDAPSGALSDIDVYDCKSEDRIPVDRVEDCMTPIVSAAYLTPDMQMVEAAKLMNEKGATGAPVISDGRLVGVLTQFDFIYQELRGTQSAVGTVRLDSGKWQDSVKKSLAGTVEGAMSKPVAVTTGSDMVLVAELMLKKSFNHVPVVDTNGAVMGILTSKDVLRHLIARVPSD